MIKLTLTSTDLDNVKITQSVFDSYLNHSLDIWEYKDACKKLAYLIGYHENNIKEAFGDKNE